MIFLPGVRIFRCFLFWLLLDRLRLGCIAILLDIIIDFQLDFISNLGLGCQVDVDLAIESHIPLDILFAREVAQETDSDRDCDEKYDERSDEVDESIEIALSSQLLQISFVMRDLINLLCLSRHGWMTAETGADFEISGEIDWLDRLNRIRILCKHCCGKANDLSVPFLVAEHGARVNLRGDLPGELFGLLQSRSNRFNILIVGCINRLKCGNSPWRRRLTVVIILHEHETKKLTFRVVVGNARLKDAAFWVSQCEPFLVYVGLGPVHIADISIVFIISLQVCKLNVVLAFEEIVDVADVGAALAHLQSHYFLVVILENDAGTAHNVSIAVAGCFQSLTLPD